jgi:hypothetical protein
MTVTAPLYTELSIVFRKLRDEPAMRGLVWHILQPEIEMHRLAGPMRSFPC